MSLPPINELSPSPFAAHHLDRFRAHWKSVLAFGILSIVLGIAAIALAALATIASVLMIGVLMCLAGIVQAGVGFRTRSWGRFLAFEFAGIVYIIAGLFAVFSPIEASVVLTLLLGAGMIATAVSRLYLLSHMRGSETRSALLFAAIATGVLGLLIVLGWPANSLIILGTLLGVDLLFQGIAWTVFGLSLRRAA